MVQSEKKRPYKLRLKRHISDCKISIRQISFTVVISFIQMYFLFHRIEIFTRVHEHIKAQKINTSKLRKLIPQESNNFTS